MPKLKYTEEDSVKIDYILAWAAWKMKESPSNIAKKYGKSRATIYNWIDKVEKKISQALDQETLVKAAQLVFPAALDSLYYNLAVKKDASVTNNYWNKTAWKDIKESESRSETNIYNLGAGANPSLRQLDHGRIKSVAERLRQRIGEAEKSPVVLRDEVSPDD